MIHKVWSFIGLCLLPLQASGLSFRQVAYIPNGIVWGFGYMKGGDWNRDGYQDLLLLPSLGGTYNMTYYGYRPYNRYVLEDSSVHRAMPWDAGFLDGDSLYDVVTQTPVPDSISTKWYINVYEQPDPYSLPTRLVWSWRYGYGFVASAIYITDLDKDGLREILASDEQLIYIFETRGDNQYFMAYKDSEALNVYVTPYFAVGDFDGDGQMEFVHGSYGYGPNGEREEIFLRECVGDDQYQLVWTDSINASNMKDAITGPDLDGDGKLEFIFGDFRLMQRTAGLWIYEATGNNQYALSYTDSRTGISDRGGYSIRSDCGDVDRDGHPELVWAIDRDWMVYKSPGNNQFQRVFSAYGDNGHNSTNIHIHDMNGNGYPEVIESGGNETHIWEVEACRVVYPNGGETLYCDTSYAVRWRNVAPFVADSFSLFYSTDSSRTYSLIAHGIPGSDSSYVWPVPDTVSDTCFIMLWAYQNATGWDFTDTRFTIRPAVGVEVFPPHASRLTPYVPCPNPFVSYATVPGHEAESFALYDVSGRRVGVYKGNRIGSGLSAGIYFLRPEGNDSKPLRIVKLR
jgi:hypothetical protein